MSIYQIAANMVMVIHLALILTVVLGVFVSFKVKKFRPVESIVLLSAIVIWSLYGGCPLTFLESQFRQYAGHPIPLNIEGFIPYYLRAWFNIGLSSATVNTATYAAVGLLFLLTIDWELPVIEQIIKRIRKHHAAFRQILRNIFKK